MLFVLNVKLFVLNTETIGRYSTGHIAFTFSASLCFTLQFLSVRSSNDENGDNYETDQCTT